MLKTSIKQNYNLISLQHLQKIKTCNLVVINVPIFTLKEQTSIVRLKIQY